MNGFVARDIDDYRSPQLEIRNFLETHHRDTFKHDIREGFSKDQKSIPSKYFYDVYGCQLFDQICCTREYYLTKTEHSILDKSGYDIMGFFNSDGGNLVELGSGSNKKIKKLLDRIDERNFSKIRYVPVDISEYSIRESSRELIELYEGLKILGFVADFTRHLEMLAVGRKMIIFLGSSIGNFSKDETIALLRKIRGIMTQEDRFLLGLDMIKPVEIIEAAYNDGLGLTEKFNLNILKRMNRELNADFNPEDFAHLAFFNKEEARIEMHLEAKRPVRVNIRDLCSTIAFRKGETLHTEICCKFSRNSAGEIFKKAGLSETTWFTDPDEWFSLVMLSPVKPGEASNDGDYSY